MNEFKINKEQADVILELIAFHMEKTKDYNYEQWSSEGIIKMIQKKQVCVQLITILSEE